MADDDRKPLTFEQAMAALDVRDGRVHCFIQAPSPTFVLIGADWDLADVEKEIREHGAEACGPGALAMKHGVGVRMPDSHGVRFFATREGWTGP